MSLPLNRLYLAHSLAEPCFGPTPNDFYYIRAADGKRYLYRQSIATGLAQALTTEPTPQGTVGYGFGLYAVRNDLVIYAAKDKKLHGLNTVTGAQWAITPAYQGVAAPTISPCGQFVAFLAEQDERCNVLLVDVKGQSLPIKLSQNPWYAFNPTFSPDGRMVAWMEWGEFDMPWDETRLVIAKLANPTSASTAPFEVYPTQYHTLGKPRTVYTNPQFSPNGQYLAYLSDESGWRSLWVAPLTNGGGIGRAIRLDTGSGEIGGPDWLPNVGKYRWSDDSAALYAIRRHHSRDELLCVAWPEGLTTTLATPWTYLTNLQTRGQHLIFIGSNSVTPEAITTLDTHSGVASVRATSAVGLNNSAELVQPSVISWSTVNDETAWGIFYPAAGPLATNPRPLIVSIHGGPTSESPLRWDPQAQYFATRGWHYLSVNHRGSTGFGRAYQDLLNGQWGVVDVEDARTGAQYLVDQGQADRQRLVITGGSAGGYTTLMALVQDPKFWAAGVSLFGIGDLYALRLGSHRFELNYEFNLIGQLPEAGRLWQERSPLTYVESIASPVLLFHGKEDEAVPYAQSVQYAEAARRQGVAVELVLYDEEGHGFVKEKNRRDQMERMEKFLDRYVLCLQR